MTPIRTTGTLAKTHEDCASSAAPIRLAAGEITAMTAYITRPAAEAAAYVMSGWRVVRTTVTQAHNRKTGAKRPYPVR